MFCIRDIYITKFIQLVSLQPVDQFSLSCTRKPQIRAIHTYAGCTKATINN